MESMAEPESNIVCVSQPAAAGASRQMIGSFLNYNNGIAGIFPGILNREYNKQINMKMRMHSKTGSNLPPNTALCRVLRNVQQLSWISRQLLLNVLCKLEHTEQMC